MSGIAHASQAQKPYLRQPCNERADVRPADQGAQAEAEEHQGQAGGELVGPAPDDQVGKDQVGGRSGQSGGRDPQIGVAGYGCGGKTRRGADQHDAFEAEVDDAGALADDFAKGGVKQRRSRDDRTGKNAEDKRCYSSGGARYRAAAQHDEQDAGHQYIDDRVGQTLGDLQHVADRAEHGEKKRHGHDAACRWCRRATIQEIR